MHHIFQNILNQIHFFSPKISKSSKMNNILFYKQNVVHQKSFKYLNNFFYTFQNILHILKYFQEAKVISS